jgi:hypothetical protein
MKLSTLALAGALALTSTFAVAQSSSTGADTAGARSSNMNGPAGTPGPGENPAGTGAGMKPSGSMERGATTGRVMDNNPTSPSTNGTHQSTTK